MKRKLAALLLALMLALGFTGILAACSGGGDNPPETPVPEPTPSVTLSRNTLELDRWSTATLTASSDTAGTIVWSSADENIAAVDGGTVTAMGIGSTTVTASLQGTQASATCAVTVTEASYLPVITFDKQNVSVIEGGTVTVTPSLTYRGSAVEGVSFTFASADEAIATVDASGAVTGVATGQTLVTASTVWRGESFTRSIQVNVNIDGSIMLYDAGENVVSAVTLRTSKPEGADDSFITDIALRPVVSVGGTQDESAAVVWESNDPSVASVDGGTIVAEGTGTAVITAAASVTVEGEEYEIVATVVVTVVLPDVALSETLTLSKTDASTYTDILAGEILGTVQSVTVAGGIVAHGSDLTDWILTLGRCAVEPLLFSGVTVATDECIYYVDIAVTADYDEVDLTMGTGVQVTEGSSAAGGSVNPSPTTVWNLVDGNADEAAVVGNRTGVYKYWYSNTFEDANAFGYRVDINNWPQGESYAYWTFDVYIPEGSNGIDIHIRTSSSDRIDVQAQPGIAKNPARTWYYFIDSEGNLADTIEADEWYTFVVLPQSNADIFSKPSCLIMSYNPGDIFYIDNMRYYSADGYDLLYTTARPAAPEMLASGASYTFDEDAFTVYQGASQVSDYTVTITSNSEWITVDGMTITAGNISADTYAEVTVRIACGDAFLEYTVEILLTDATVLDETYFIDYLDPSTYTIQSDAIEGTITSVSVDLGEIATSADLTEWVTSFSHVAAQDRSFNMLIRTDSDLWYVLPVTLGAAYEEVDLVNGVTVTQNGVVYDGTGTNTVWTEATDTSVVGDRTGVMKYQSAGLADAYQDRVDINNWPQNAGYYYWTFDFYIAEGTGFRSNPRTGSSMLWTEPRVDQAQPSGRNWYYMIDAESGAVVTELDLGAWYTMVMFVSPSNSANGPFAKESACLYGLNNEEALTFYIDDMRYYTQDEFDLFNVTNAPAGMSIVAGESRTLTASEFGVQLHGSALTDCEITLSSEDDAIRIDGMTISANEVSENTSAEVTVTIAYGSKAYRYVMDVDIIVAETIAEPFTFDKLTDDAFVIDSDEIEGEIESIAVDGEVIATSADISDWIAGVYASLDPSYEAIVTTSAGVYVITINVTAAYDEVDLVNDIEVAQGTQGTVTWTSAEDSEITEGREGVMRFSSTQASQDYRVQVTNWPYQQAFRYVTFDVYLPAGTQLGGGPALSTSSNGSILQVQPPHSTGIYHQNWTWFYMIDENGHRLAGGETVSLDAWYTIVVFDDGTNGRDPFNDKDTYYFFLARGTEFYIDNMRYYTEEKFDLDTEDGAYEEVDLVNGVTVTQNGAVYDGTGANTVWTAATDSSVVGEREGVMKFETAGLANEMSDRVDINNWPQNAGYYYVTFDFYIAEGNGFRSVPRNPGTLWTEPRVDQDQNPARNWYYTLNMSGEKVTSLSANTWYTMVMFVSPSNSANGPFAKSDFAFYALAPNVKTVFYIDNMRFYAQENFDLYTGA